MSEEVKTRKLSEEDLALTVKAFAKKYTGRKFFRNESDRKTNTISVLSVYVESHGELLLNNPLSAHSIVLSHPDMEKLRPRSDWIFVVPNANNGFWMSQTEAFLIEDVHDTAATLAKTVDPNKAAMDEALAKGWKDPVHKAYHRAFVFMCQLPPLSAYGEGLRRAFIEVAIIELGNRSSEKGDYVKRLLPTHSFEATAKQALDVLKHFDLRDQSRELNHQRQGVVDELRRALKLPI